MAFSDIPILSALKNKMKWHQARQGILAQNIANANTPKYKPNDLKQVDFSSLVPETTQNLSSVSAVKTNAAHINIPAISFSGSIQNFEVKKSIDWEITPNGNGVSLEDQMIKVTENQMDYQAVTTLYSRSLGLLRLAIGQN